MSEKIKRFSNFVNEDLDQGNTLKSIIGFFTKAKNSNTVPSDETGSKSGTTSTTVPSTTSVPVNTSLAKSFINRILPTVGVKESPANSNSGPEVNKFLSRIGLGGRNAWCMAYVYTMFDDIFKDLGKPNKLKKTGAVMTSWNSVPNSEKIGIEKARNNPSIVKPGMVFYSRGKNIAHTGIVLSVDTNNKTFKTIEGNLSNKVGMTERKMQAPELIGFVDFFSDMRNPTIDSELASAGSQIYSQKV